MDNGYVDFQKDLQRALTPLMRQYVNDGGRIGDTTRADQLREARRALWFYKGVQYLKEVFDGRRVDWVPVNDRAVLRAAGYQANDMPTVLAHTNNSFTGDVNLVASILARISPRAKPTAHDVRQSLDTPIVEAIERVLAYFDGRWNNTSVKMPIARWFAMMPGGIFSHVQAVADAGRFGTSPQESWVDVEVDTPGTFHCMACGEQGEGNPPNCPACNSMLLPDSLRPPSKEMRKQPGPEVHVPNIGFEVKFSNLLHTWITPGVESLEQATWLVHQDDLPLGKILQQFDVEQKMFQQTIAGANSSASGYTNSFVDLDGLRRLARSSTGRTDGANYNNYTVTRLWLDPAEYVLVSEAEREKLERYFPEGVRTSWLHTGVSSGPMLIEAVHENFRDCWAMRTHDGQPPDATPSHFRPYFDLQVAINDVLNLAIMSAMASGDTTLIPKTYIDGKALQLARRFPGSVLPVSEQFDRSRVHKIEGAQLNGTLMQFIETLLAWARSSVNITDAVRGNSATGVAREAVINREQSTQAFQPMYRQMLHLFTDTAANVVRVMARYRMSRIWFPKSAGAAPSFVEVQDLGNVLKVGWRLDVDESLPLSRSDQRTALMDMLAKVSTVPPLLESLGFNDPLNSGKLTDMLGIPDFVSRPSAMIRGLEAIFESIMNYPDAPPEFRTAPAKEPELSQWRQRVLQFTEEEEPIAVPNGDHIPLDLVAQQGSFILNFSPRFRMIYRSNFLAWARMSRYVRMAKEMMPPPPPVGPDGNPPPPGPPQGGPPGQVPDGTEPVENIPASPGQGLPAMSQ